MVVVPDRQLSLAIGKEGQNARLAARLAGWRLDIKGLTEWEEIKESVQKAQAEKAEPEVAVEEAAGAVAVLTKSEEEPALEEMAVAAGPAPNEASVEPEAVLEQVTAEPVLDEDAVLEALIREEEESSKDAAPEEEAPVGLSVEELASFTMDEVEEGYDDEEELEPDEGSDGLLTEIPVLTPDAGKIRFAEDLVGEFRGPGRTGRRAARQGGARGPARGNSNRGGGAR